MTIQKKQLILVLVILLAVIGLVGSGCLKNNDNDSSGGADAGTSAGDNSQKPAPPSNNDAPTDSGKTDSNNANTPSSSSSLPDVVYANQGSGGGSGSNRNSAPTEITSKVGDQTVVVEEYEGDEANTYNVYVYVPTAAISTGDTLTVTFLKKVDSVAISEGFESVLENPARNGKSVTVDSIEANPEFGDWGTSNLEVKIGEDTYYVSFFASSVMNVNVAKGGQVSMVETKFADDPDKILLVKGAKERVVVGEVGETRVTIIADKDMAGTLSITDSEGEPVECTASGFTYTFNAESKIYFIDATFEKAVKASLMIDDENQNIIVDQNLVENGNIFLYVPAENILGEKILLKFNSTITKIEVTDEDIFVSDGVKTTNSTDLEARMSETNKVTQKGGVNPETVSFVIETKTGTYNVYLLASALLNFDIPEGYTLTVDDVLDLEAGKHSFVTDVGKQHTFSFTHVDGNVDGEYVEITAIDVETCGQSPFDYLFGDSKIYTITIGEGFVQ